jgi:hypothetical protein
MFCVCFAMASNRILRLVRARARAAALQHVVQRDLKHVDATLI